MNMTTLAFIQNLSGPELILIAGVILLFFGAKRMPELFQSLGKSMREFKKAVSGIEDDIRTAMDVDVTPETKAPPSGIEENTRTAMDVDVEAAKRKSAPAAPEVT